MFRTNGMLLSNQEAMLLNKLDKEYTNEIAKTVLIPLIEQTSSVSLRALDWAVVNWSKQNMIICSSSLSGKMTNVHNAYRSALTYWKRKLFDPFRRRQRIDLIVEGKTYQTTLGQANFALFVFKTGILAYVIRNIDAIEDNMNTTSKNQKHARQLAQKHGLMKKRRELTCSNKVFCVVYNSQNTAHFE